MPPAHQTNTKGNASKPATNSSNGSHKSTGAPIAQKKSAKSSEANMARRGTRVNFSVGFRRKSIHPEVDAQTKARRRWKHAYRTILAFIRFQIPLVSRVDPSSRIRYAPTYKLRPDPSQRFRPADAKTYIERILNDRLETYEYGRFTAPKHAKLMSALINDRMKDLNCPRYKFISSVVIMENKNQDMSVASRSVWDKEVDEYVSVEVKGATFVVVACVHAVYVD